MIKYKVINVLSLSTYMCVKVALGSLLNFISTY
jgi:hypothetical protein